MQFKARSSCRRLHHFSNLNDLIRIPGNKTLSLLFQGFHCLRRRCVCRNKYQAHCWIRILSSNLLHRPSVRGISNTEYTRPLKRSVVISILITMVISILITVVISILITVVISMVITLFNGMR